MVYLVIKELSSVAEDVIMVTSSIMKDMQPNLEVIYRPNAIRALARIIDVSIFFSFPCETSNILTWHINRRRRSFQRSDSSSLPLWTEAPPYLPLPSSRLIIFTQSPVMLFEDGPTRRKRPRTERQVLPAACMEPHQTTLEEEARLSKLDTKPSRARVTSCSTTPWVCCTSSGKRTGWR